MKTTTSFAMLLLSFGALGGCDGGITRGELDASIDRDAAPAPPDPCAASGADALSTLGCNGGFASPPDDEIGGACTRPDPEVPGGTCRTARTACLGPSEETAARMCMRGCPIPDTYVATGDCPTGHRCFRVASGDDDVIGICYRDCDEEHPCPEGWYCDADGGCTF